METAVRELQHQLAALDLQMAAERDDLERRFSRLLFRLGSLKIRMRRETNHRKPHFHVEYGSSSVASYAIDTLERLAGEMSSRHERTVTQWAATHRELLMQTWQELAVGTSTEVALPEGDPAP